MKRIVWTVQPAPKKEKLFVWCVRLSASKAPVFWTNNKEDAIAHAKEAAKNWHAGGGLAQVRIKGKDGRIQREHTYGRDPERHAG